MNSINITGRLVADVEQRKTGAGTDMCRGTIAVKTLSKEGVNYFDFFATGSTANAFVQYTRKGAMVGLSGRLVSSNYEDKNGNKRKAVEIVAENVSFCGGKSDNANTTSDPATVPDAPVNDSEFREIPEDDLPF